MSNIKIIKLYKIFVNDKQKWYKSINLKTILIKKNIDITSRYLNMLLNILLENHLIRKKKLKGTLNTWIYKYKY